MLAREGEEAELAVELALDLVALRRRHVVPLVDAEHQRAAGLEDEPREVRVLLGHALARVEQQDHDVGVLDRLQRLHHRELLDRLEHLAPAADAGGVDQRVAALVALEVEVDRVARRARLVEGDDPLLAEQRVHQRRLADVRAADDRDLDPAVGVALLLAGRVGGHQRQRVLDHRLHVVAVRRRDRMRLAQPQLVEIGGRALGRQALGLVHRQHHRAPRAAQQVGDRLVLQRQSLPRVGEEDHRVGLGDGLARLLRHLVQDAVLGHRLEAAGVDDQERAVAACGRGRSGGRASGPGSRRRARARLWSAG